MTLILRRAVPIAVFSGLLSIIGCGGGDDDGPAGPGPTPVATSIAISSGDNQTALIGTAVAIAPAVIVRDQNGAAFAGAVVTFTVETGGGSVAGATDTTDASGIARAGSWTLGTAAGSNTLLAASAGLTGSPVRFIATASTATPVATTIALSAGNNQSAPSGTPVAVAPAVIVRDQFGAPFPGAIVTFAVATGGGSVAGAIDTTDASGIARAGSWTLGPAAGANTLTATAPGLAGSPVLFSATATAVAPVATTIALSEGNNQSAAVNAAVAIAPAVIVRDQFGAAIGGTIVTFSIESGGGSVVGATDTTDVNGIARVGSWTLGATAGANTLLATAAALSGSPVRFTATATSLLPNWTIMVYLAADNNLTLAGVGDIDEMEAAGADPRVKVVVQAEFSPQQLALVDATAADINRPNFNTFRYEVAGQLPNVSGPNGAAEDIGNRNMTDPNDLIDFVEWAKTNHPAEHYALVLWNHGGGYTGLLQDVTTAGNDLMSVDQLRTALQGTGPIDFIDFDMCLMGAYETLVTIDGFADFVAFAEEVVPGEGNPYTEIIDAIQANPTADARTVAQIFVEEFHTSFIGNQASTTKSAYDLAGFAAFETKLDALAMSLRANLPALETAIATAAASAQAFEFPQLKDCVDFLQRLRAEVTDPTIDAQIDEVIAEATGSFRVANRARTGDGRAVGGGAASMDGANGLTVLMPSGGASDRLADMGPGSFAEYAQRYAGTEWTLFLTDWLLGGSSSANVDQGSLQFEMYLVWQSGAVEAGADVDLWVFEPNGNLFIPYVGTVTPNGVLTNDSYDDDTYYEGYFTNRFIEAGTYLFFANLYTDPLDFRPLYDVIYRNGQASEFTALYDPDFPELSLLSSWLDDPTPTPEEIEAGAYTDLHLAATLSDVGGEARGARSARAIAAKSDPGASLASSAALRRLTPAQLDVARGAQKEIARKRAESAAQRADAQAAFVEGAARGLRGAKSAIDRAPVMR
ncbi:MAG: clostripain-related cysteine peptidase [bacterium]